MAYAHNPAVPVTIASTAPTAPPIEANTLVERASNDVRIRLIAVGSDVTVSPIGNPPTQPIIIWAWDAVLEKWDEGFVPNWLPLGAIVKDGKVRSDLFRHPVNTNAFHIQIPVIDFPANLTATALAVTGRQG